MSTLWDQSHTHHSAMFSKYLVHGLHKHVKHLLEIDFPKLMSVLVVASASTSFVTSCSASAWSCCQSIFGCMLSSDKPLGTPWAPLVVLLLVGVSCWSGSGAALSFAYCAFERSRGVALSFMSNPCCACSVYVPPAAMSPSWTSLIYRQSAHAPN